jgi:RNA polymerase sigma factor (sigma-70 family)
VHSPPDLEFGPVDRSDGDLVRAVRAGDRGAWDELVARHSSRLWAIARANGLDAASAADVVQTGWLNLIESVDRIRNPEAVGGWLATVVRHESIRMSKVQRRGANDARLLPPDLPPVDEGLLRSERIAAVRSAFDRLSPHCRELLRLLFSDAKLSYEEIATILDRPVGSLGPTRGRCLADLRELLERPPSYQPRPAFPSSEGGTA